VRAILVAGGCCALVSDVPVLGSLAVLSLSH